MRIATGTRVTRTRGATVHIARVVDARGTVHAICGTAMWRPTADRAALIGADCVACLAIEAT